MMHPRWLALPLAAVTGCVTLTGCFTTTGYASGPRLLPADLHVGALDQRTRFELDDGGSPPKTKRDVPADRVDTPKQQRRRKILYFTGLGAAGFGAVGLLGFGIGGRIVQGQLENGYGDGSLTHAREDQLTTTGVVMNGLAIGSAVVGLAGVILSATMYGIDHARCGDLPPRRKNCPDKADSGGANSGGANSGEANPGEADPGEANPGEANPGEANPGEANPGAANPANPGGANPGGASPGGAVGG